MEECIFIIMIKLKIPNSKHSDNVRITLKSQINDIVKLGHKLILVYPVPRNEFELLWKIFV